MTSNPTMRTQADDDGTLAFGAGANAFLYMNDPGPREVNIGTAAEPRMVLRTEAVAMDYAAFVLTRLDGDLSRIRAAGAYCRRRAAETSGKHSAKFRTGAELCDRAARTLIEAGDEFGRRRALAYAEYGCMESAFGGVLGAVVGDARTDLRRTLREIRRDERRARGRFAFLRPRAGASNSARSYFAGAAGPAAAAILARRSREARTAAMCSWVRSSFSCAVWTCWGRVGVLKVRSKYGEVTAETFRSGG